MIAVTLIETASSLRTVRVTDIGSPSTTLSSTDISLRGYQSFLTGPSLLNRLNPLISAYETSEILNTPSLTIVRVFHSHGSSSQFPFNCQFVYEVYS